MKTAINSPKLEFHYSGFAKGTPHDPNASRRMKKAVANLAKTPTGRYLLKRASALGYDVFYDAGIEDDGATGLCSQDPRTVQVLPDLEIHKLAFLLVHELTHSLHFHDAKMPNLYKKHPNLVIMRSQGMEADAWAHVAIFALEFAFNARNRTQYNHVLNYFIDNNPKIAAAAIRELLLHETFDDKAKRAVMRAAFEAYYRTLIWPHHASEKHILKSCKWSTVETPAPTSDLTAIFNEASRGLVQSFRHMRYPYLDGGMDGKPLNFNNSHFMGITRKGRETVEKALQARDHMPRLIEFTTPSFSNTRDTPLKIPEILNLHYMIERSRKTRQPMSPVSLTFSND